MIPVASYRLASKHGLWLLYLTGFVITASQQILAPLIPIYFKEAVGASLEVVGLLVALLFLSSAAGKILITLYLRRNIPTMLLIGCVLLASSPILYLITRSQTLIGSVRILHGLGFSLFATAGLSLASLIPSADKDKSIGHYTLALSLGLMVGPGVGSIGVRYLGFRSAFLLSSAAGTIASISSLIVKAGFRNEASPDRSGTPLGDAFKVFRSKLFQTAFLCYLSFSIFYGAIIAYAPIHLKVTYGLEADIVSLIFFLYFLVTVISRFLIPRFLSTLKPLGTLLLGFVSVITAAMLIYLLRDPLSVAAGLVMVGLSHGIIFPSAAIIVSGEAVSPSTLPAANAVYLLGFDLGAMLGPISVSSIASSISIPAAILTAATPAFFATPLLAAYFRRTYRKGIN